MRTNRLHVSHLALARGAVICVLLIMISCIALRNQSRGGQCDEENSPSAPALSATEDIKNKSLHIKYIQAPIGNIHDFGWRDDDTLYFSMDEKNSVRFFSYSLNTGLIQSDRIRESAFTQEDLLRLSEKHPYPPADFIISPSAERVVFLRTPDAYVTPTKNPRYLLQPPPDETIWLASNHGSLTRSMPTDFYPSSLMPMAHWYQSEEILVGGINPIYGFSSFFLLHFTKGLIFPFRDLITQGGSSALQYPVYNPQMDAIANADLAGLLWIYHPTPRADWAHPAVGPLFKVIAYPQEKISPPEWSADGRWLYYWRTKILPEPNGENQSSLERFNLETQQSEIMIPKEVIHQLFSGPGTGIPDSSFFGVDWRLSGNGHALAFETGLGEIVIILGI
jgi:hypothetical protein